MFTKFKCCCLLIVCIPIIYGYTETAQSFSEQLRALYRTKNAKELQKRLMPLKQEKPVFDDLFGTETGDRYYALGKLLKSYSMMIRILTPYAFSCKTAPPVL